MTIVYQEQDGETHVGTKVHDLDTRIVIEKTYDAEPFVEQAQAMRNATAGQRWGEMRHVGFIPNAELATMMRQDGTIDNARLVAWLKANPKMVTFDRFLK